MNTEIACYVEKIIHTSWNSYFWSTLGQGSWSSQRWEMGGYHCDPMEHNPCIWSPIT